jgi:hypothetical protein
MAMKMSVKLVVSLPDESFKQQIALANCLQGHGVQDVEEMTYCPDCDGYMCMHPECDCACAVAVFDEDEEADD